MALALGWEILAESRGADGALPPRVPATLAAQLADLAGGRERDWADLVESDEPFLESSPDGTAVAGWTDGDARVVAVDTSARDLRRRASAGDLAAGVSHELGNALSAIVGWTELLVRDFDHPERDDALLSIAVAARSAKEMTAQLLGVVREDDGDAACDVATLLQRVERLAAPQMQVAGVELDVEAEGPLWAEITAPRLFRAIWNLVLNAIQILPAGGHVSLRAQLEGSSVLIEVSDDGPGMDAATAAQVFTPYFTRRAGGTGLGLALVDDTVQSAGGRLELTTRPGEGAHFAIHLPALLDRRTPAPHSGPPAQSGTLRLPRSILVVEDDDTVRDLVRTLLELREMPVRAVGSMREAFECTEEIELALVDLTLRDGRGEEVLRHLRERWPAISLVAMTGRAELSPDAERLSDGWLRKPFEPRELLDVVLSVHAGERATSRSA